MTRQELMRFAYTRSLPLSIRQKIESVLIPAFPPAFSSQKILFIHIPKTGGKSIGHLIGMKRANHSSYMDYRQLLGEDRLNEYFIFSLVRDPADRLISTWKYLDAGGNRSKEDAQARKAIFEPYKNINDFVARRLTNLAGESLFFRSQTSFLKDSEGHLAKDITIVHLENLDREKHLLPDCIRSKKIPHLNKTKSEEISLTNESMATIKATYHEDYEMLGY